MKFEIRKSSDWDIKPCEEAIKETITVTNIVDVRNTDSPYKIWQTEEDVQKNWFGIGKNHRVMNGKIVRDMEDEVKSYWVIEFNHIEDLLKFQEKYGDITLKDVTGKSSLKVIEIKFG